MGLNLVSCVSMFVYFIKKIVYSEMQAKERELRFEVRVAADAYAIKQKQFLLVKNELQILDRLYVQKAMELKAVQKEMTRKVLLDERKGNLALTQFFKPHTCVQCNSVFPVSVGLLVTAFDCCLKCDPDSMESSGC